MKINQDKEAQNYLQYKLKLEVENNKWIVKYRNYTPTHIIKNCSFRNKLNMMRHIAHDISK